MRHPSPSEHEQEHFQSAVTRITEMENVVRTAIGKGSDPDEVGILTTFNAIQAALEAASSALANEYNAGGGT